MANYERAERDSGFGGKGHKTFDLSKKTQWTVFMTEVRVSASTAGIARYFEADYTFRVEPTAEAYINAATTGANYYDNAKWKAEQVRRSEKDHDAWRVEARAEDTNWQKCCSIYWQHLWTGGRTGCTAAMQLADGKKRFEAIREYLNKNYRQNNVHTCQELVDDCMAVTTNKGILNMFTEITHYVDEIQLLDANQVPSDITLKNLVIKRISNPVLTLLLLDWGRTLTVTYDDVKDRLTEMIQTRPDIDPIQPTVDNSVEIAGVTTDGACFNCNGHGHVAKVCPELYCGYCKEKFYSATDPEKHTCWTCPARKKAFAKNNGGKKAVKHSSHQKGKKSNDSSSKKKKKKKTSDSTSSTDDPDTERLVQAFRVALQHKAQDSA